VLRGQPPVSGRPGVPVVQSSHEWNGDDPSFLGGVDVARLRGIALKREVCA
jgi:hypothetical protein